MKDERNITESISMVLFLLLIASLGFMQPSLNVFGVRLHFSELIFVAGFAFWAFLIITKKTSFRWSFLYVPLAFYIAALAISALFSASPKTSFIKLAGEFYLICLSILAFNVVRTIKDHKFVVFAWLFASLIVCLVGFATVVLFYIDRTNFLLDFSLHFYGSLPPGNYPRVQSTFIYPSMLCNYLTVSLLMLLAAYELEWIGKAAYRAMLFLTSVTIAFTITPGIGGVFLAAGLWYSTISEVKNKPLLSRASLYIGVFIAALFIAVSAFTIISTSTSPFFINIPIIDLRIEPTQRLLTWFSALQTFFDHPLTGKGLGLPSADVLFLDPSGNMQKLTDAHNIWLNIAAQSGLPAVVAIILICFYILRRSLSSGESVGKSRLVLRHCYRIAFLSAFIYQGLVGSFENARHIWIVIGLLASISETEVGDVRDTRRSQTLA